MEKDRKIPTQLSSIIILLGFLMSCSLTTFIALPSSYFAAVPSNLWLFGLASVLLAYLFGFAKYFFTSSCSIILEICEYVLLPVAVVCLVQRTNIHAMSTNQDKTVQQIQDFTILSIIIALTLMKILYINQTFPGESHKEILDFDRKSRFFRTLKLSINCLLLLILKENDLVIVRIILNCLDFAITLKSITFVSLELEEILLLANFNNILSIFTHHLTNFNNKALTYASSEILLLIVFVSISNPLKFLVEFKCLLLFQSLETNRNQFKKKDSKGLVIMFLSCYNTIYDLHISNKLVLQVNALQKWSKKFIQKLVSIYKILLSLYFQEISQTQPGSRKNAATQGNQYDFASNVKQKYHEIYKDNLTQLEILENKDLFLTFVAFCMDNIYEKELKTLTWSYSNEFLLTFVSKLGFNFLMKKNLYFYQRLALTDESITYKTRNKKVSNYLKYYKKYYEIKISPMEHYMEFERQLAQFKDQISEICTMEIKIVESFGDSESSFKYLENLESRQKYKTKIDLSIQKCFSYDQYLHFEQFTYLYLLFKVIFCKTIYRTSQQIYEKFIIPKKDKDYLKNHISKVPIAVTCGLESQNKVFGEIIMTNTIFRKKFGVCSKETLRQIKISDLIVGYPQKSNHLEMMLESSKFSEVIKTRSDHSQHKCFLKINLEQNNFHILKQFKVTTSIAHSFEENFFYICKIEQANNNQNYILSSEAVKISRNIKLADRQQIIHSQLKCEMHLMRLQKGEFPNLLNLRQEEELDFEDSLLLHYSTNQEKMSQGEKIYKFTKIQNKIWEASWLDNRVLVKLSFMTIMMSCLIIFLSSFAFFQCRSFRAHSKQVERQISDYVRNIQASPLHLSLDLTIKSKIDSNDLAKDACMGQIPNLLDFVIANSYYWVGQKFNQYFQRYPFYKEKLIPILDIGFWSSLQVEQQEDVIDISNYLSIMSSLSNEYLNSNLSTITNYQQQQLIHFIALQNRIDQASITSRLLNGVMNLTEKRLKGISTWTKIISMAAAIIISVLIGLLLVFLLRTYCQYLQYFELQSKIGQEYLNRRASQIKYITKQIDQMKNSYTECEFTSHFQVSLQTLHNKKYEERVLRIDEFEKVVQTQTYLAYSPPKYEWKELYFTILRLKKFSLSIILISLLVVLAATILNSQGNSQMGQNSIKFLQMLKQGQYTREHMKAIISANWIKYLGYSQVRENDKNKQIFEQSTTFVDKKSFITTLISNNDQSILEQTLNLNLCRLLDSTKANQTSLEACQTDINEFSQLKISSLITIMAKNENAIWEMDDRQMVLKQLCRQTKSYFQYLEPGILSIWQILQSKMDTKIQSNIKIYLMIMCCGATIALVCIIREVCTTYYSLTQILKFQIFTMETAEDLYNKPYFRPYLNRMYYQEVQ